MRKVIPWAEPRYWGREEQLAVDALRSTWISGGPYVERLEEELQRYCGTPYAVATSNGTTALHAALLALGVGPGDEVIVPAFAFMAAANVLLNMSATPVFADVDPDTWCMTAQTLERCIGNKTRGVVPVHTYGNVCDMAAILEVAREKNIWVLEDAAEAFGSRYRGQLAGAIASIGTYSFHATKTITTGEGGAVVTRDESLCERMRLYRSHGVKSRRYWHDVAGHNFRLTNVQAAIGCAQFECIEQIIAERARVYRSYKAALSALPGIRLQTMTDGVEPVVWAIGIELEPLAFDRSRDDVIAALGSAGIETRPGFYPAADMSHLYSAPNTPHATALGHQVISLPSSPTVSDEEIDYIVGQVSRLGRAA
jgi:perosamine synthetase